MRLFFWRRREPLTDQEAIRLARHFLKKHCAAVTDATPAEAVFQPADLWHDYDRWLVYFTTRPGCDPPFTVVEIKMPGREVALLPMI